MTVLIAGGGSGGHISPGLAVAEALADRTATHFVCSQRAVDVTMLEHSGHPFTPVPAIPPSLHPLRGAAFAMRHLRSRRMVRALIADHDVKAVVLMGGFVSVSAAGAAHQYRVPSVLLNLDCIPGRANRWLAPRVTRRLAAMKTVTPFDGDVVGMPIRSSALPPGDRAHCCEALGLDTKRPVLLVTGASQGAGTINALVPACAQRHPALFRDWQILHLTGTRGKDAASTAWARTEVDVHVEVFRHDMGVAWGAADLVVSRAGAGSMAELGAAGVPAVLLPYPHHRDRHQWHNARDAVDAGAAVVVEDRDDLEATMPELVAALEPLLVQGPRWHAMHTAALQRRGTSAAADVANAVMELLK